MVSLSMLRAFANGKINSLTKGAYISYQRTHNVLYDLSLTDMSAIKSCRNEYLGAVKLYKKTDD